MSKKIKKTVKVKNTNKYNPLEDFMDSISDFSFMTANSKIDHKSFVSDVISIVEENINNYKNRIEEDTKSMEAVGYISDEKHTELYNKYSKDLYWKGSLGLIHPIALLCERIELKFGMLVGCIVFEPCNNEKLRLLDKDGKIADIPCLGVLLVGNKVWDFTLGHSGKNLIEYMSMLYEFNDNIRINYNTSRFMAEPREHIDGMLTEEHCNYVKTRAGLSRDKFISIEDKLGNKISI